MCHGVLLRRLGHEDRRALAARLLGAEVREQRNLMRTRQSRAEAFSVVQGGGDNVATELGALPTAEDDRISVAREAPGDCRARLDGGERRRKTRLGVRAERGEGRHAWTPP